MESEVNQICSKLTDENKAKEELAGNDEFLIFNYYFFKRKKKAVFH